MTLNHWVTILFLCFFPDKCFWWCLWLRPGLISGIWPLYSSTFPEAPHLLWPPRPQSTPSEALPSSSIDFPWQYSQSFGYLCCLSTCYYEDTIPINIPAICFHTALCKQPAFAGMTSCDLLSEGRRVLKIVVATVKSAVFPTIVAWDIQYLLYVCFSR